VKRAARGERASAFDERRILAAGVAPPSHTGGILGRALSARRSRRLEPPRLTHETPHYTRLGATEDFHHGLLGGRRFGYWRDPVCIGAVATYIGYRVLIPVDGQTPLWSGHFADLLLIPAGLPLWLWLERRISWRGDDRMPRWREIAFALVTWTVAAELIAPQVFLQATGDVWDAVAYASGALFSGVWWQRGTGPRGREGDLAPRQRSMPHDEWSESAPHARA